jgi:molybdate transport system substrate-binding protein
LYAIGRLALIARTDSPLNPEEGLAGLARLLDRGQVTRFAIANPEHAPYGRAAEAALRTHGLWGRLRPRLVLGENVAQAAQFALTGDAVGGIIAHSLALAPNVQGRARSALLSDADHPRLRQRMVLLKRAGSAAQRFYEYLQTPAARAILQRHGFSTP